MFDFVFVVLTYRNYQDLKFFFEKNNVQNSKVIVVNSFFDEESRLCFEKIANENNADFINVENKGYGYGNNRGVEFAVKNYKFKYLIISNADVEIIHFNVEFLLSENLNNIYAPEIKTLSEKHQNPFIVNYSYFYRWLYYVALKKNLYFLKYIVYISNGIIRRLFIKIVKLFKIRKSNIYSSHGSFLIIGKEALSKISPLYYEEMFLYNEEFFLARKAMLHNVKLFYIPFDVSIKHFEDGSQDFSNKKSLEYSKDSYIKYFEYFKMEYEKRK